MNDNIERRSYKNDIFTLFNNKLPLGELKEFRQIHIFYKV
jgi:hypothetical protein